MKEYFESQQVVKIHLRGHSWRRREREMGIVKEWLLINVQVQWFCFVFIFIEIDLVVYMRVRGLQDSETYQHSKLAL